eukprot:1142759-Pelagomonas_calceolata.AAC.7
MHKLGTAQQKQEARGSSKHCALNARGNRDALRGACKTVEVMEMKVFSLAWTGPPLTTLCKQPTDAKCLKFTRTASNGPPATDKIILSPSLRNEQICVRAIARNKPYYLRAVPSTTDCGRLWPAASFSSRKKKTMQSNSSRVHAGKITCPEQLGPTIQTNWKSKNRSLLQQVGPTMGPTTRLSDRPCPASSRLNPKH